MLEEEDCDLRIVELVFERASLLDRQSVRLPAELVSHPVKDLEGKGQNGQKEQKDKCKMRTKENRTKRQCQWQDGYAFLPFEGRSW